MKNVSNSLQEMFAGENGGANALVQYIDSLNPETIARLSAPTPEVRQAMEASLSSLLGGLPPQNFGVTITTNRENLGQLLASAMMNGYFLHSAQQRMTIDQSFATLTAGTSDEKDSDND